MIANYRNVRYIASIHIYKFFLLQQNYENETKYNMSQLLSKQI